jgi:hypothetical protein
LTVGDATVELQCPHDGSVISIQFRSQIQLHAGVSGGRVCNSAAYYCAIIVILHGFCHFRLGPDQILQCFAALAVYATGFHFTTASGAHS